METTTIKISNRAWLALKQVQVSVADGKASEVKSFGALIDAIGFGNDELLKLFREKMRSGLFDVS